MEIFVKRWNVILVVFVFAGLSHGIHRNTADITRKLSQGSINTPRRNVINPAPPQRTRNYQLQNTYIQPQQRLNALNINQNQDQRRFQNGDNNFRSTYAPSYPRQAPVDLPREQGNQPPYQVVTRNRQYSDVSRDSHSSRGTNFVDTSSEPVGEPPVLFLNRDRIRRRNQRRLEDMRRRNRAQGPTDVQASSFERRPPSPYHDKPFPFREGRMNDLFTPLYQQDPYLPYENQLQDRRQTFNERQTFQRDRDSFRDSYRSMTSFPPQRRDSMMSGFQERNQLNTPMPRDPSYMPFMRPAMVDAPPIEFRRMLSRRRRMRNVHRFRNIHLMGDPYFMGPPPLS